MEGKSKHGVARWMVGWIVTIAVIAAVLGHPAATVPLIFMAVMGYFAVIKADEPQGK